MGRVVLQPGREAPLLGGHPWLFSGSIRSVEGAPSDGDVVDVLASDRSFVARGLWNGRSQIRVRCYARAPVELDDTFFADRIREAVRLRSEVLKLDDPSGACRLVFSEGDGISGLTVDRYGPWLAVQLTSLALALRREALVAALQDIVAPHGVILRTEKGILEEEGLELRDGPLVGTVPAEPIEIVDGGLRFHVDLRTGHKTGFYLDQRDNRSRAAAYAGDRTVADVFCYSGGFTVAAAAGGAKRVTAVDSSAPALELATANADRNGVSDRTGFVRADAFRWLEAEGDAGRRYGMVILDPPRFARTSRGVRSALSAYERLNALALRVLEPDGILVTCSCSGRVSAADFVSAVGRAAATEARSVQILEQRGQAPDHPVAATCPESSYLKCLVCRVV